MTVTTDKLSLRKLFVKLPSVAFTFSNILRDRKTFLSSNVVKFHTVIRKGLLTICTWIRF